MFYYFATFLMQRIGIPELEEIAEMLLPTSPAGFSILTGLGLLLQRGAIHSKVKYKKRDRKKLMGSLAGVELGMITGA